MALQGMHLNEVTHLSQMSNRIAESISDKIISDIEEGRLV